jgi:CRISPR-associated endonuclease/helicase Cas3
LIEEETDDTSSYSSYFEKLEKARKLSAPLTVATTDQLVTSVFKYNGFEMPYLTASYSKIVLDEVQSFSSDAIAAIVRFLKDIHGLGGKFLLMTATLPSFVKDELLSLSGVEFQMAPLTDQKRHRIAVYEEYIDESVNRIIKDHNQGRKVLVICNTVKKAQAMYDHLSITSPQLLHSRFIQQDRNNREQAILTATAETGSCVWIATQVVEASLDIDFDVLYTECSTIDSLLQRFGRCFRKRDFHGEQPNIYIYSASKESLNIYDPEILSRTYNHLRLDYNGHILLEADKQKLIEEIFGNIQLTKYFSKYKSKMNLLECMDPLATKKAEANEMFRNITNNYRVIPMPVYVKNGEEIEKQILKADSTDTEVIERIKARNTIGHFVVPVQLHGDWKKRLMTINHSLFCKRNGISILRDVTYSCDRGLQFSKGDDFDDRCI